MEKTVEVPSNRKSSFGKRACIVVAVGIACVPAFAQVVPPTITVDYAAFGTGVIDQVQTMLAAIIPAAAVLFGTMKGVSWVRAML